MLQILWEWRLTHISCIMVVKCCVIEMPIGGHQSIMNGGAHWHYLVNTIELSMAGQCRNWLNG